MRRREAAGRCVTDRYMRIINSEEGSSRKRSERSAFIKMEEEKNKFARAERKREREVWVINYSLGWMSVADRF